MARKPNSNSRDNGGPDLGAKLDELISLVQDLFILQAMSLGAGRDSIFRMLGVHTSRVSKISKAMKRALKHGKEKA